jgi:Fic family protein
MSNPLGYFHMQSAGYESFVAYDFPPELKDILFDELLRKANQAQHLVGKLSGVAYLLPDVDYFINAYKAKDATASAQIEGTKATMVDAFELSVDEDRKKSTDAEDILFYIKALNYGLDRLNTLPVSLRFIKELHAKLLDGARVTHFADPGEFRKTQNWIGGTKPSGASYVPPTPEDMVKPLNDLEIFIHSEKYQPIIQAGLVHAQFETIHPFLDGNGRTGRLLITFFLLNKGLLDKPILFLSSYFRRHQKVYYEMLQNYHYGDIAGWLEFFLDGVIEIADESIKVSVEVTKLREQDMLKVHALGKPLAEKSVDVLQKLYTTPVVTSTQIRQWTNYTRQGVVRLIDRFIELGILKLYRQGEGAKPSVFIYENYTKIFEY